MKQFWIPEDSGKHVQVIYNTKLNYFYVKNYILILNQFTKNWKTALVLIRFNFHIQGLLDAFASPRYTKM